MLGPRGRWIRLGAFAAAALALAREGSLRELEAAYSAASLTAGSWIKDEDLSHALYVEGRRTVTAPIPPRAFRWTDLARLQAGNDTLLARPGSLCWRGGALAVADETHQRVLLFDESGRLQRTLGGSRDGAAGLDEIAVVRCSAGRAAFLTADHASRKVSFWKPDGEPLSVVAAPTTPQFNRYVGDFALAPDGRWYDSWLGSTRPAGPYLEGAAWESVHLVRGWGADGRRLREFGRPAAYRNPVARRVFNRTFLALGRDTLWVLTQGNATIQGFTGAGASAGPPIRLPVHYRGAEPKIFVDELPQGGGGWRPNRLAYQPNVRGLAVLQDSLFAVIRYREWAHAIIGPEGNRWLDYFPKSAVEVVDRGGTVLASVAVPGRALAVASDGGARVAVLTEDRDGTRRIMIGSAPLVPAPRAGGDIEVCATACGFPGAR